MYNRFIVSKLQPRKRLCMLFAILSLGILGYFLLFFNASLRR